MILTRNTKIKLFTSATKPKAAYMGTVKVYPNSSLAVTASLAFAAAGGSLSLAIQVEDGQSWSLSGLPSGWSASSTSGTGSASVTITAPNNTTTAGKGGTITVISEDLSAACVVSQAAGAIVYETPIVTAFGYPDIPAAGGTVAPNVYAYQQTYTWNGVPGSGGVLTTGGTIYYSNTSGLVSAGNLGTTIQGRTAVYQMITRVDMNGVTGQNASCYVYQAENAVVSKRFDVSVTGHGNDIPHAGGVAYRYVTTYVTPTYSSGAKGAMVLSDEPTVTDSFSSSWLLRNSMVKTGLGSYTYSYSASAAPGNAARSVTITYTVTGGERTVTTMTQAALQVYKLNIAGSSGGGLQFNQWATFGQFKVYYGAGSGGPWLGGTTVNWSSVAQGTSVSWTGDYPYTRLQGDCNSMADAAIMASGGSVVSGGMTSMGQMDCVVRLNDNEVGIMIEPRPR